MAPTVGEVVFVDTYVLLSATDESCAPPGGVRADHHGVATE